MDGVTLTAGRPGRASPRRRARPRWPGPARLLREPFTRRAWAEFGYTIACVPTVKTKPATASGTQAIV